MKYIIVVGLSGSGKTTFSSKLSKKTNLPHIHLDDYYWKKGWQATDHSKFPTIVKRLVKENPDGWIMDGNYHDASDEYQWDLADTIIFLDYPIFIIAWRIISRTLRRMITNTPAASGNKETLKSAFFSKNSLLVYNLRYPNRVKDRVKSQKKKKIKNQEFIKFKTTIDANRWLK